MKNRRRIFFFFGVLLVLASIWPVLPVVNRIYPFVLGLPFFPFYMLMLNLCVLVFLAIAFRNLE